MTLELKCISGTLTTDVKLNKPKVKYVFTIEELGVEGSSQITLTVDKSDNFKVGKKYSLNIVPTET